MALLGADGGGPIDPDTCEPIATLPRGVLLLAESIAAIAATTGSLPTGIGGGGPAGLAPEEGPEPVAAIASLSDVVKPEMELSSSSVSRDVLLVLDLAFAFDLLVEAAPVPARVALFGSELLGMAARCNQESDSLAVLGPPFRQKICKCRAQVQGIAESSSPHVTASCTQSELLTEWTGTEEGVPGAQAVGKVHSRRRQQVLSGMWNAMVLHHAAYSCVEIAGPGAF